METCLQKTYIPISIAALFTKAGNSQNAISRQTDKQTGYPENGILRDNRNKLLACATIRVNPRNMLSQMQKTDHICMNFKNGQY